MTFAVQFERVSRHFGSVKAVDQVSLAIDEGSFFALLGPSGSGKTTCLRLISGFDVPSDGQVRIFGQTSQGIPPNRRPVNTVFQDYALFPHMTVLDNVAYGLMVRAVGKRERYAQAGAMLELVKLAGYEDRKPNQLSGGQRQRVALARALVTKPRVLLLDEPLGALDLKLREAMQEELKSLQRQLKITFVFVTHDQSEALSMADQVAVFNDGHIIQTGSPQDIYQRPRTRFVADFVGSSNIIPPDLVGRFGGSGGWSSLKPEAVSILLDNALGADAKVVGVVRGIRYMGATRRITLAVDDLILTVDQDITTEPPSPGAHVGLSVQVVDLHSLSQDER